MPTPRYRVTGVPPEAPPGMTAYLPHFNRYAASGADKFKYLKPGSGPAAYRPISNMSATRPSPDLGDLTLAGTATSANAPDAIWPNDYDAIPHPQYWPGAGMPVQMYDPTAPELTTMIPVPAVNPSIALRANSASIAMGVSPGGRQAMSERPRIPNWRPRRKRGNGIPSG